MATPEDILYFRALIDEPTQQPYTDEMLGARLDAAESADSLARTIWTEKAAQYAGLADVKEGNSDRKLSQLYKNALAMSASFTPSAEVVAGQRHSRTRQIERQ